MTRWHGWLQDWNANRGRPETQVTLVLFRLAHSAQRTPPPIRRVVTALYRVWSLNGQGIDLPPQVCAGPSLQIHHGIALVVHGSVRLGANVILRQSTTLGQRRPGGGAPEIGDDVEIGAHVLVLGPIVVGASAVVAAGATVLADVPPGATVITKTETAIRVRT